MVSRRTWADLIRERQNYNSLQNNNRLENVVAAAKLLHSYPNLCDLMECSLSGSSAHGIFQARECWIPPKKGCPTPKGKGEAPVRPSVQFSSVQFSRSTCPILRDPMNCSTPGFPIHHQLQKSTQIHVHRVSDAIQPSHPLSSPSPSAPNPSQHQGLFQ